MDHIKKKNSRSHSIRHTHTHTQTHTPGGTRPEAVISSLQTPLPTQITTNTKDEHHVISGIQTRGSNNQAASEPCVDLKATGTGTFYCLLYFISLL